MIQEISPVSTSILIPGKQEKLPTQLWFENFGTFLKSHPDDKKFCERLTDEFWKTRPKKLKELDNIFQEFPHTENVGDHSYHVATNLDTAVSYNGENYLKDKPDIIKVVRTAAILHDIGKRRSLSERHTYESAQEVEQYLKWMDFSDREINLCLHLIAHHDIIGKVANPKAKETIDDIIKICLESPIVLQCLWTFTMADIGSIKGIMESTPNILNIITKITRAADYQLKKRKERKLLSLPK